MPFKITHGHEYAAYKEIPDEIVMPDPARFESVGAHAATALHEAAHATGTRDRLNRECFERYHTDKDARAAEELVAEFCSVYLNAHLGVAGEHIDNHAAYLDSWLRHLRRDKRHLFKAAADAQRACDWLLDRAGITSITPAMSEAA